MCFDHVITQTHSKTSSLSGRFGGEKRLEDLTPDVSRGPLTIVGIRNFNFLSIFLVLIATLGLLIENTPLTIISQMTGMEDEI